MNLQEIKQAVKQERNVYWSSLLYKVVYIESKNDFFIKCLSTKHLIGLTWNDGITLNGKEEDFFVEDNNVLTNLN